MLHNHVLRRATMLTTFLLAASITTAADAGPWTVYLRGTSGLGATAIDQNGQSFGVGGLSGITYLGGNSYAAAMDNSGKVVLIDVDLNTDGTILSAQITGGLSLATTHDFESIAYTGAASNTVYLAEESTPGVREYSLATGAELQSLAVPAVFANMANNRGFESLTIDASTSELWTANEEALTVDGGLATQSSGTTVRLLRYVSSGNSFAPAEQFAYEVEPLHAPPVTGSRSGLVDLVTLPDGELLALERSLALSSTEGLFKSSLFSIDLTGASDVSALSGGLQGQTFTPVAKSELWSGVVSGAGMNMEGLTLGPALGNGRWALLGIVDNGDPLSTNSVVAFELVAVPEPSTGGLALLAILLSWGHARGQPSRSG